jgi:hypothetical protein
LHGGEIVSTDRRLGAVWGETSPGALNTAATGAIACYERAKLGGLDRRVLAAASGATGV